jgi:prepilin-type N-terminal cleavage/methylation domain-containing protein
VNFIKDDIKDKKRKKGFTLIELLISMFIVGIISSLLVLMLCRWIKIQKCEMIQSREEFYMNQAQMIIENQINIAKYVDVANNMLRLKSYDRPGYDYIRKNKDNDIIISYDSMDSLHKNYILKDIKEFKVEQNNQLVYMYIQTKEGNVYKRCFGLERTKVKDIS